MIGLDTRLYGLLSLRIRGATAAANIISPILLLMSMDIYYREDMHYHLLVALNIGL